MGIVELVQFQIVPCSSLYFFSRSIGPFQCLVNVNYRVLIWAPVTSRAVPSSLFFFGFLSFQASSVPNFRPDTRGRRCSLYLGSLAQLCCGEGGTLQTSLACVRSARSVWSTLCLPQLTVACASRVYTAQAPGCFAGALSKAGLHSVHFPGLSCSGSVSHVLHKGTDSAGCVFCALPRSEQLR